MMRPVLLLPSVLLLATLSAGCGPPQLEGVGFNEIQLEGEHAEELKADLEEALLAAGATLNDSDKPDLIGTIEWDWAGDKSNPYPTRVKIFIRAATPSEQHFAETATYEVPQGAQPQDINHYRTAITERVVSRIAAQNRGAS